MFHKEVSRGKVTDVLKNYVSRFWGAPISREWVDKYTKYYIPISEEEYNSLSGQIPTESERNEQYHN